MSNSEGDQHRASLHHAWDLFCSIFGYVVEGECLSYCFDLPRQSDITNTTRSFIGFDGPIAC